MAAPSHPGARVAVGLLPAQLLQRCTFDCTQRCSVKLHAYWALSTRLFPASAYVTMSPQVALHHAVCIRYSETSIVHQFLSVVADSP